MHFGALFANLPLCKLFPVAELVVVFFDRFVEEEVVVVVVATVVVRIAV